MAEILSLSKARKARTKAERDAVAGANRAKFGRTKAEKARDATEKSIAEKVVDGHKREP